jgi:hypothetical protein
MVLFLAGTSLRLLGKTLQERSFVDALLALPHKPTQLVPCANARDSGRRWALPCDGENVAETVIVETGHCAEMRGQRFALARLKLLEQVIHGLFDELLCGVLPRRAAQLVGIQAD